MEDVVRDQGKRLKQIYYETLCHGLQQQWTSSQYTDTEVKVEQKSFRCHKVVLAAMSPFFEAMYLSGMQESQNGVATLHNINAKTFENILKFIYTGEVTVTTENVEDVLQAATMLQIKCLKERCEEFMIDNVDPENCVASWKLASSHECGFLARKAWKYLLNYFSDAWETEDFLKLDCEDILSIIKDNDLRTPNEETVCEAVFKWLNYDLESRKRYIDRLFENLRLPLMQPEYLLEKVDNNELVKCNEKCREFVNEAIRYHLLPARRHEFVSARLVQRNQGDYEEVIVCIGGNIHPEVTTTDVWCYSLKEMEWVRLTSLPYDLGVEFAVCAYGNAVFVSGGSEAPSGMIYLHTMHNTWLECRRMLLGRRRHCMVAVGDSLYVLGGYDDESEERFSTLMSVEKFGVVSGNWEDCGYLEFPVRSAAASVVRDKIYIFGGIDADGVKTTSVQCFDTRSRSCTHLKDLPSLSGMSSAIVCNRTTYLIFPNGDILKIDEGGNIESGGHILGFDRCGFGVIQHEGTISSIAIFGLALGYGVGSLVSNVYVTLERTTLLTTDNRYIGAWWLAFIIISACTILTSIPMFCFPRKLSSNTKLTPEKLQQVTHIKTSRPFKDEIKHVVSTLSSIVKSSVYVFTLIGACLQVLSFSVFLGFEPKYMETQFAIPAWQANIVLGVVSIISYCIGCLIGGIVTRKWTMSPFQILLFVMTLFGCVTLLLLVAAFLGCEQQTIQNWPNDIKNVSLSLPCDCKKTKFLPICGDDGNNYYSPCHAGCSEGTKKILRNCTLITGGLAKEGLCNTGCSMVWTYSAIKFIMNLVDATASIPVFIVFLRAAGEEHKALALGLSAAISSLSAWLPGPVIGGKLIDSTCLIWNTAATSGKYCAYYNIEWQRYRLHALMIGLRIVALLVLSVALLKAKKLKEWPTAKTQEYDAVKTEDNGVELEHMNMQTDTEIDS